MLSPRTRRFLIKLHRWTGLIIGLWIVTQSITGLAIIWREDLDRLLVPSLLRGSGGPVSIDVQAALDVLRAAAPGTRIARIELPAYEDGVYRAWLGSSGGSLSVKVATVDPATGKVLGIQPLGAIPGELLFRLHYALLAGDDGRFVIGLLGTVYLLFLVITGPLLWWPGGARLKAGFTMKLDAGRARMLLDLHRVTGVVACVVLIPLVTTGALTALKPQLQTAFALRNLSIPAVTAQPGVPLRPADSFVATALAQQPGSVARELRFAGAQGQNVTVIVGTPRGEATGRLYFNGYDGNVVARYDRATVPPAIDVPETILWLHKGELFGAAGRLVIAATALVPLLLAVTGVWMWLRRTRARRRSGSTKPLPQSRPA
ncbi:MAG: putative PepSY-associated helix domain protein [Rhodospirillales bacterium]|nr:putative PepSY-associated helix domain protein [Rhodospirillales bacterium]